MYYLNVKLFGHQTGAEGQSAAVSLEKVLNVFKALLQRHLKTYIEMLTHTHTHTHKIYITVPANLGVGPPGRPRSHCSKH